MPPEQLIAVHNLNFIFSSIALKIIYDFIKILRIWNLPQCIYWRTIEPHQAIPAESKEKLKLEE